MEYSSCNSTPYSSGEAFTATVKLFVATQCCFKNEFTSDEVDDKASFDFIIVGAGTAGSVVANRLSEVEGWNVLLLEAGTKPPNEGYVPLLSTYLLGTKYDWNYTTVNNNITSQAFTDGQVSWPRGRVLGGSSILNGMLYVKGRSEDYQSWFNDGNPSWSPDNVYRHERKAESLQNYDLKSNPYINKFYGQNGPQVVNRFNNTYRLLTDKVLDSWDSIGFKRVIDANSANYRNPGLCSITTVTAANGLRHGTYRSYLLPARERKNLKIITEAFVTKVLVDENKKAYGVEVDIRGKKTQYFAKNEVIISGGTINSPQLLMLSGIGPKKHLKSKNIRCKADLPAVGRNLQDHLSVFFPIYGDETSLENRKARNCAVEDYCCSRKGYLAQDMLEDIISFYSSKKHLTYPEYQNHLILVSGNIEKIDFILKKLKKPVADSLAQYIPSKTLYLFLVNLLHPYSRGVISLNTSNPYDKPIIDANYYGDERDLESTVRAIFMLKRIVETPFFKSINAFVQRLTLPECDTLTFNTIKYWECYTKSMTTTVYHPVGTCKMGPNPRNSVVDNFLRVHRVKNLRVIDASIMPTLTSGNTNGPTIMIGEMGADMIKDTYNVPKY